jgi:hypothetical protein
MEEKTTSCAATVCFILKQKKMRFCFIFIQRTRFQKNIRPKKSLRLNTKSKKFANTSQKEKKRHKMPKKRENLGFGMEFALKGSKHNTPPMGNNFNNGRKKDARKKEVKQNDQAFSRSNRRQAGRSRTEDLLGSLHSG